MTFSQKYNKIKPQPNHAKIIAGRHIPHPDPVIKADPDLRHVQPPGESPADMFQLQGNILLLVFSRLPLKQ